MHNLKAVLLSQRNLPALDGLRGLAIIAVMFTHCPPYDFLPSIVRIGFGLGWSGVDLFFVLSGFLITGILIDSRDAKNYYQSFYCRRLLRIFPLYYTFLMVALVLFPHVVRTDWMPLRSDYWLYVCYLMNWQQLWHEPWHANVLGHFWTLCVEEQFYIVWPIVVFALRPRLLLWALIGMDLTMLCGRCWWIWNHGASILLTTLPITRMDGLLFGAACAIVIREFLLSKWRTAFLWVGALLLVTFASLFHVCAHSVRESFIESVGFAFLGAGFAAILLNAALTDSDKTFVQTWLRWKPLTLFGKYSYGIYVLHVPIFYFIDRLATWLPSDIRDSHWLQSISIPVRIAVSFGAAAISYTFFEKRFLRFKSHFEPEYPNIVPVVGQTS